LEICSREKGETKGLEKWKKKEDVAGNYEFSEHSSEYEGQEIREEKK
jgi:hypothetical protein